MSVSAFRNISGLCKQISRGNQSYAAIGNFRRHGLQSARCVATKAVALGDKLPSATFNYFDQEGNYKTITTEELCKDQTVVLFAVPGAFTPTCSTKHLPGFIEKEEELKSKGIDTIACIAVNDHFVMDAWGKQVGAQGKILMLADGSGVFTKAIGVELNLTENGLGVRSRRYAMVVEDQTVKQLNLEEGGAFDVSSAEEILKSL